MGISQPKRGRPNKKKPRRFSLPKRWIGQTISPRDPEAVVRDD